MSKRHVSGIRAIAFGIGACSIGLALLPAQGNPRDVGELGPVIPFHKDAIHSSLTWNEGQTPKLLFAMRPSEYRGTDLVDPTVAPMGALLSTFDTLVYGGFGFSSTLDASVQSRINADIPLENTLLFDLAHPDAFRNRGVYDVASLTTADCQLNAAAFRNAGGSCGLHYNLFCGGNVALADGRIAFIGGHDKGGNNGIRKINIFDPVTETWLARPDPAVRVAYLLDPTGNQFPHPNALDELNTDPLHPADMQYQRWYPTAVTLPDGRVLILSGSDQDTSVGPSLAAFTKVRHDVPEVYDPATDSTHVLPDSQRLMSMYPRSYVVQTGPGVDDWRVLSVGEVQPPLPTGNALRDYDPFSYNGNCALLDVLGAERVPEDTTGGVSHWTPTATASLAHESGAAASLVELDDRGHARSQRIVLFGGANGNDSDRSPIVEMIDMSAPNPQWVRQQDLPVGIDQNLAVALPDGTVFVGGGRAEDQNAPNNLTWWVFHPATGQLQVVATTTVPRHDHATAQLLPDGSVAVMGGNRVQQVPGNRDAGVPTVQVYRPAYLFQPGHRPSIRSSPTNVHYGSEFELRVQGNVRSVAICRIGPVTHNWDWGNRYVKLAADRTGNRVRVRAPAVPGLAVPGVYMLFVLDNHGVPSAAARLHLGS
jgi:hypothetical protein